MTFFGGPKIKTGLLQNKTGLLQNKTGLLEIKSLHAGNRDQPA